MAGVLQGLRVVELGQVLAGPFFGAIFADLGAEVIKVERAEGGDVINVKRAEGGDDARRMGPAFRHGDAMTFHVMNRGKQSRAIDLRSAAGLAELDALLTDADIMVHNLRPGVAQALGIDGATLTARHTKLIYCEISAFGHLGPMAQRPGYEPLLQAYSGLSSINGGPDDPPMRAAASLCDQGTAMWLVIGALSLLHRRRETGHGGIVQGSLLETALMWSGQKIDNYVNTGELPARHRSGHPGLAPYEAFDAADGPFLICAGNDRLFGKLAAVLGRPDWSEDPRFVSNRARLINKPALFGLMHPILASKPRAEWIVLLEAAGVPAAQIHSLPEALQQPQVQALGMSQAVPGEDFSLTALPITIDGARPQIAGGAPRLGQHNV